MADTKPAPPVRAEYLAFTVDTPQDKAKEKYMEKYGVEPQYVFESKGLILAGPILR